MALETPEEIQQFLVLQQKSEQDLRALCEGMELTTVGTKDQLIERLLTLSTDPQTDIFQPQLIALRTKYNGQEIPGAEEFMRRVRKVIYEAQGNTRDFFILNGKNEPYQFKMKFAKVSTETLNFILTSNVIYPHPSQRELVKTIKEDSSRFLFHIVNRQYGKDKSFVMLHCESKQP